MNSTTMNYGLIGVAKIPPGNSGILRYPMYPPSAKIGYPTARPAACFGPLLGPYGTD